MKKAPQGYSLHSAFTMLELIFIIIIIGILTAMILPSTRTNPLQEAAVQLATHIRYTQHLAIVDDKYDRTDINWYKRRWQIVFGSNVNTNGVPGYTIFSDRADGGDANVLEIARNPSNLAERMSGGYTGTNSLKIGHTNFVGMNKLNLGMSYGVTTVTLGGGCGNSRLAFDSLGRPFQGDHDTMTSPYNTSNPYATGSQRLIMADCTITLSDGTNTEVLRIRPETGYVSID